MKILNKFYLAAASVVGLLTACSDDFLERKPLDSIVDANFYKTNEQILAGTAGLYNQVWFAYNDKASHGLGDARGGVLTSGSYQVENVQFNTTALTGENISSWRSFYNAVGQSNTVINNIRKYAGPNVDESVKKHAIAEARFMRGLAYSFLVQNWGAVPVITDNTTLLQDTSITRNTVETVWEFICRDIRYGTENLPTTPVAAGRLTQWAAKGMLAKMYLTRAGVGASSATTRNTVYLDSARILAEDVIENSGASLLGNYEDLFRMVNNNNSESLFALQWTYNGTWGTQNSVQAFLAYSSSITGFADGWGSDIGASMYMLGKYEGLLENGNTPDARRKATFMLPGDHYTYVHALVANEDTGKPEEQELRVPLGAGGYNSRAWVKKYVVGRPIDNAGKVLQQRTEINTYMLRLADVYLVYAEAILGNNASTSNSDALQYFNAVRERANLDPVTSFDLDDIYNERALEFAMEGQVWYDFVRMHYFDPEKVYDILSDQERGFFRITPDKTPNPTSWTFVMAPKTGGGVETRKYTVSSANFAIPLPAIELQRAPNLRKVPVPYEFD
jgi:starch-binding outer membrane protein, SusD/RagB family